MKKYSALLLLVLFLCPAFVRADVSLFLHEAIGVSGEETAAGHASIYFSNVCADGPVRLRMCHPGETGVVITAYPEMGADKNYEWLAIPLLSYLYGVENERNIPLYTNGRIRMLLRETYRRNHLRSIVADLPDGAMPLGRWKEVIGTVFNRDIYAFTLKTTAAEDAAFLEKFNLRPNQSRWQTLYHNCADFAREVLNLYFPHAARRDVLNDFTMTTPKAIAKSLTRYATHRPERLFYMTKYSQLSGPIRRSLDNRKFSEMAIRSKKYLIPQIILKQSLLAIFATSYYTTGYFNAPQQYKKYGSPEIAELNLAESQLKKQPRGQERVLDKYRVNFVEDDTSHPANPAELASKKEATRIRLFGTRQTWEKYRAEFAPQLQKAIAQGFFADAREVTTFFKDLELQSETALDENGQLLLKVKAYGKDLRLGLTRDNILSSQSSPQLAYKLMLVKINTELNAREKNRESLDVFEDDWTLLNQLATRCAETAAADQPDPTRPRFLEKPEVTTFQQKFKKFFVLITH